MQLLVFHTYFLHARRPRPAATILPLRKAATGRDRLRLRVAEKVSFSFQSPYIQQADFPNFHFPFPKSAYMCGLANDKFFGHGGMVNTPTPSNLDSLPNATRPVGSANSVDGQFGVWGSRFAEFVCKFEKLDPRLTEFRIGVGGGGSSLPTSGVFEFGLGLKWGVHVVVIFINTCHFVF